MFDFHSFDNASDSEDLPCDGPCLVGFAEGFVQFPGVYDSPGVNYVSFAAIEVSVTRSSLLGHDCLSLETEADIVVSISQLDFGCRLYCTLISPVFHTSAGISSRPQALSISLPLSHSTF